MLMPSIFSDNWFDDFMDFPFYNDRDMKKAEKKDEPKEEKTETTADSEPEVDEDDLF